VEAHGVVTRRGSHIFHTIGSKMAVRMSAIRARKVPDTHFCYRLSRHHGHCEAGKIRSFGKPNDLIGNRTRGLPFSKLVPQPTTLPFTDPEPTFIPWLQIGSYHGDNHGNFL
jgi:hypothetical protein